MKKYLILASIAAVAVATPTLAQPSHAGHGKGNTHAKGKVHGNKAMQHRASAGRYGMWGNSCPPGLARKNNNCLPPGQARKRFQVGQRWIGSQAQSWNYNQIPADWRDRYDLDANDRYYYRDGYLYQVDPRTRLVEQVLSAILR